MKDTRSIEVPAADTHIDVYLFRHQHMARVVRYLLGNQEDEQVWRAWAWGKAFGYSEEAIAEFIPLLA